MSGEERISSHSLVLTSSEVSKVYNLTPERDTERETQGEREGERESSLFIKGFLSHRIDLNSKLSNKFLIGYPFIVFAGQSTHVVKNNSKGTKGYTVKSNSPSHLCLPPPGKPQDRFLLHSSKGTLCMYKHVCRSLFLGQMIARCTYGVLPPAFTTWPSILKPPSDQHTWGCPRGPP